jgi:HlyD family secretion protein
MTASVEVLTNRKEKVLTVPLASVTTREIGAVEVATPMGGEKKEEGPAVVTQEDANAAKKRKENTKEVVFVMEKGGKVKQIEVKTGISDFENIEILSGLTDGQEIISGPYATVAKKLKAGDLVKKKEVKKDEKASEKK